MDFVLKSKEQVLEMSYREFLEICDDRNCSQISIEELFAIVILVLTGQIYSRCLTCIASNSLSGFHNFELCI